MRSPWQPTSGSSSSTICARAADLALAGVAGAKAYAYGPWRQMLILEPGARVFDGKVTAVSATGVRFAMDGGLKLGSHLEN